ncbi:MAG: S46 family peptidase [Bacteroidetes bacterium]|nr:S46 family peptidase [Bacteroidota bacterium]
MKRIVFSLMLASLCMLATSHKAGKADEGMFPLSELKQVDLKSAGLRMDPMALYNPNGVSTIDAIVRVGGCTGSFVSEDGLIVTNHHCAFSFVHAISDTQNKYMDRGFLAKTKQEEAPAKGLVCKITASYEDVSDKVLNGTQETNDPLKRLQLIATNIKTITDEENKKNPGLQCEISEMFTGRTYVLFRYKLLKDVRLVYVPGRSIGEYGGEKDNWVWPRHSGDFAFLRAYVAPDGSAADYSVNNVPYKPIKHLKINIKGVKENDFVFILGYPGRTFRNQPAGFYQYHEKYMLKYVSDLFNWQIQYMENLGKNNPYLELKYAARIKSLANTAKNYEGKLQGFRRVGLSARKKKEEQEMHALILKTPELKAKYETLIPELNATYEEIIKYAPRNLFYDYLFALSPSFQFAAAFDNYRTAYKAISDKAEKEAFLKKQVPRLQQLYVRLFGQMDPVLEKALLSKMFDDASKYNSDNEVVAISQFYKKNKTEDARSKAIDKFFSKCSFNKDSKKILELMADSSDKVFGLNDDLIRFAHSINPEVNAYDELDKIREGKLNSLLAKYVDAKSVINAKQFIPDANGTLRFTYGYVKGYSPNDGEWNKPFTTLRGVIEKEDGVDYELLDLVKELYRNKDLGNYIHPDLGDLPVDFLYNLDTTGGNSGSPVCDADGNLVGVNFDRAFTATINDYAWNESYSRSVAVDIRYVCWVVEKVAGANELIKELGLK